MSAKFDLKIFSGSAHPELAQAISVWLQQPLGNGLGRSDLGDPEPVRQATQAAIHAAVVTTTRRGAEPPWAYELAGHDGWRWLPPGDPPG